MSSPGRPTIAGRAEAAGRDNELGGAMVFVLLIGTALLFIAGTTLHTSLNTRRADNRRLATKDAFFCAETALETARVVAAANQDAWNDVLSNNLVAWHPITGACPGSTTMTFSATIRDNGDDDTPGSDSDGAIIIDAETLQGGVPLTYVSGFFQAGAQLLMADDYNKQYLSGAVKDANDS